MALEPGDQLGDKLYCRAYNEEEIEAGKADYLTVQEVSPFNNLADKPSNGRTVLGIFIEDKDEGAFSVYLNDSQVDDLIVTLLYWKENH